MPRNNDDQAGLFDDKENPLAQGAAGVMGGGNGSGDGSASNSGSAGNAAAAGSGSGDGKDDRDTEMMARLDKLEADLRDRDSRLDQANRTVEQLLSRGAAPVQAAATSPQDPGAMPDATLEPDKFKAWLPARLAYERAVTTQMVQHEKNEATTAVALDNMWAEFQREFPDAAKDEELAAAAFSIELRKSQGQIPADRKKFISGIAQRLGAVRGKADDDPANNRTGGVSGGSSAAAAAAAAKGAARSKASEKGEVKVTPFADQIANIQQKMGLL